MKTTVPIPGHRLGRWTRLALAAGLGWLLQPTPAQAQCNQLVWADEFNTPGNFDKWQVYNGDGCNVGNCNFGNAELQVYRPGNATVAGGYLNITTRFENSVEGGRTYNYTSAKLQSKIPATGALQTFRYGRIEARMKLPSAQGVWPAFWMLADPGNWPYTGEIDIMEAKHKNPKSTAGTIHYDAGGWHFTGREYGSTVDLSQDFHVYAVEWSPDQIKWFVDNTLFHTVSPKTTTGGSWPFNDGNFYLILNSAVGGPGTGFTGYQNPTSSDFPTTTQVDYVRVYQGTYNYTVAGANEVHQGDQNKTFRLDAITGGTYAWSVPAGATIVSGQGTNAVLVNFGSGAVSGNITASVAVSGCPTATYTKALSVTPALQLDRVYEDFESNRVLTYGATTGTLTQAVANPSAVLNTSAKVGKYVRNPSEQYDVLNVRNLGISNANDFVQGRRRVFVDVYSTAPAGSKITMQFENSTVTTAINFPYGRHSAYRAYTTRQNAWETLEFEFEKGLDAGTSIYSINNVAFLMQPATSSGATFYFDNLLIKKQPEAPVVATDVLLNYDGTARLSFDAAGTNGAYSVLANPSKTAPNTSNTVARYVRNASEQYDVLFFDAAPAGTVVEDAALFKNQTYQFQVDVYSTAPVGTPINLTLQNKALASPQGSFPAGRNSTYLAATTRQNQWETLTFAFNNAPDGGTANVAIDQLAFLFNSGVASGDTYYLDNIRVARKATPTYVAGTTFENYDNIRNLPFRKADGTYVAPSANPSASGINTSANVARYTRNATAQYDALMLTTTQVKDGSAYAAGQKRFALDVYTSAPVGTIVSWQLESSAVSNSGNYPTGRHSVYQAVVKQTNAWHTLTFSYTSAPDPGTADADVDNVVLLFGPNSTSGAVFYLDNLRSLTGSSAPANVAPTVSLTSPANNASFTAPATLSLTASAADADGTISKVEFYNGTTLLNTDTSSPYAYSWTGVAAGTYSLTARATDNAGAVTTSAPVSVTISATPPPAATNLALNRPVTVSSVENAGTAGSAAVDGNGTTRWSSAFSDSEWLYVDLGASYSVNRVKLTWEGAYGKNYRVEISNDHLAWTALKTVAGNTALVNDHTGLSGTGRYVRILGTLRGTPYGYSLYELEVYGTAASGGGGGTGPTACTGTLANGDYSYEVSTTNGTVSWKFIPLTPIAGSNLALLYVKVGSGGYAGYTMTAAGSNFTFAQAQAGGAALSFYFTYRVGTNGPERNSSATPHSYTAGTTCTASRTALATTAAVAPEARLYPNPARTWLTVPTNGPATLTITDALGRVVHAQPSTTGRPATEVDVQALRPGLYFLTLRGTQGPATVQRFTKE
ncbi:discoidin domain-containing protein [Hymenobacter rubripertinctus]|uniref:Glycosyl hydrolase family protein n=1 Tax=Hymenobacter rubripertinctus TaxID=2029981 RepID=A0A418R6R3_9BACT|nr:family 16 glycosylhydrolase [Hymenobacter rubripertinctus]RIY12981.1 glycosyl hydrolase family protein [Hymenobacter rubripertinctus]